jgi:hypothetical protein
MAEFQLTDLQLKKRSDSLFAWLALKKMKILAHFDRSSFRDFSSNFEQGCQIFLGPNIPKREKYTKLAQTIPKEMQ